MEFDEEKERRRIHQDMIRKRRLMARRRRRALFRLVFLLFFFGALLSGILYLSYTLISCGNHLYHEYQSMYAGYTERQQVRRGFVDPRFDGYTNVLFLGIDDGANDSGSQEKHADTLLVASLENETGRVRFIHIPRDTWVTEPEHTEQMRIKNLYAAGGAPMMVRAVNQLLGISIHQYVVVDMDTFADLIDALGGVDLYVEEEMNYEDPDASLSIHLKKGYQHLDGKQVQEYLRYRSPELGDTGRVQRQQRFVRALYQNLLQFETIPHLPAVAELLKKRVETSAEIFDSAHLANVLRHMSSDAPGSCLLPGAEAGQDETIWVPDEKRIDEKMQEWFPNCDRVRQNEEE